MNRIFYFKNKKGQLFALELKELAIGFLVGAVAMIVLMFFLLRSGIIPLSLLEKIIPAAK
ncbi:MAG: hypothetical protein ACLFPQ_04235 [Candidatus Woesearchaeota archaeon]